MSNKNGFFNNNKPAKIKFVLKENQNPKKTSNTTNLNNDLPPINIGNTSQTNHLLQDTLKNLPNIYINDLLNKNTKTNVINVNQKVKYPFINITKNTSNDIFGKDTNFKEKEKDITKKFFLKKEKDNVINIVNNNNNTNHEKLDNINKEKDVILPKLDTNKHDKFKTKFKDFKLLKDTSGDENKLSNIKISKNNANNLYKKNVDNFQIFQHIKKFDEEKFEVKEQNFKIDKINKKLNKKFSNLKKSVLGNFTIINQPNQLKKKEAKKIVLKSKPKKSEEKGKKEDVKSVTNHEISILGKYTGQLKNGKPEGEGIMMYKNGDKYEGNFQEGMKQGNGKMTYENGDCYDGEWKNDLREGKGSFYCKNKNHTLKGKWKADKLDKMIKSDYIINKLYPQPENEINLFYEEIQYGIDGMDESSKFRKYSYNGTVDEKDYPINGIIFSDKPTIKEDPFYEIELYDGEFKKGIPWGKGSMTYHTKEEKKRFYTGEIRDFMKWGEGEIKDEEGKVLYEGNFEADKKHGFGIGILENIKGAKYEGGWVNDMPEGMGQLIFDNGDKYFVNLKKATPILKKKDYKDKTKVLEFVNNNDLLFAPNYLSRDPALCIAYDPSKSDKSEHQYNGTIYYYSGWIYEGEFVKKPGQEPQRSGSGTLYEPALNKGEYNIYKGTWDRNNNIIIKNLDIRYYSDYYDDLIKTVTAQDEKAIMKFRNKDGIVEKKEEWFRGKKISSREFYNNGKIKSEQKIEYGNNTIIDYYENGNKKKEFYKPLYALANKKPITIRPEEYTVQTADETKEYDEQNRLTFCRKTIKIVGDDYKYEDFINSNGFYEDEKIVYEKDSKGKEDVYKKKVSFDIRKFQDEKIREDYTSGKLTPDDFMIVKKYLNDQLRCVQKFDIDMFLKKQEDIKQRKKELSENKKKLEEETLKQQEVEKQQLDYYDSDAEQENKEKTPKEKYLEEKEKKLKEEEEKNLRNNYVMKKYYDDSGKLFYDNSSKGIEQLLNRDENPIIKNGIKSKYLKNNVFKNLCYERQRNLLFK